MKIDFSVSLPAETIFHLGSFPVSNALIWQVIIGLSLTLFFLFIAHKWQVRPKKLQAAIELFVEMSLNMLSEMLADSQAARKIYPFAITVFLYIMSCNLFTALLPVNAFTLQTPATSGIAVPFIRAPFSDYNQALILALISVTIMQVGFIFVNGFKAYVFKFFNFKSPIDFMLGIMDIIGEFAKLLSLSFRLFGNIFAGEVLTTIILLLVPFLVPIPFTVLGLFTAVIQAFVFALLSAIFIHQATGTSEPEPKEITVPA